MPVHVVNADQPLLSVTQWLGAFLLALLDIVVLLSFLVARVHLSLADLLRLKMTILLLDSLLGVAQQLDAFLLALITYLSGLLLAVLDVTVLRNFLGTGLHLKPAEMAVLLLDWE